VQVETDKECRRAVKKLPAKAQWPFAPRIMQEDDSDLVYAGWMDSLKGQMPYSQMRNQTYRAGQAAVIAGLLEKPQVEVLIAAHPDGEPKFGFLCYEWDSEDFILHYIYVRSTYRRHNIASALLQFAGVNVGKRSITATHWTKDIRHYREKWNLDFNPWLAWRVLK
jgi:GNAT superfamily N-acetyltransferase